MEGQTVSHYKVLEKLGGGGMGVVYKALDTKLNRAVALKFLPPELTRDDEARQRFVQEAQAASALDHPNICTVYDIDSTPDGQLFIAMAFYDGETLKKRIEHGPLPVDEALDVAIQIAQGLKRAHEARIVHRDIKPANLIVTTDGTVKIVDFGIAKLTGQTALTQTGLILGTMAYMSPEQLAGDDVDQRTDLWALGVVLYEMLTGQRPFRGEPATALMSAILNDTAKPVREIRTDLPGTLSEIVSRCLQKKRDHRYESAAALQNDLKGCLSALKGPATPEDIITSFQMLRTPKVALPAVAVVVLLLTAAVWMWNRDADARWARVEAIPEVLRLIQQDEYDRAYALVEEIERRTPDEPSLGELWPEMSGALSFATTPAGADVYYEPYSSPGDDWVHVGQTPLQDARLPRGVMRVKIEKEGFETLYRLHWSDALSGGRPRPGAFPRLPSNLALSTVDAVTPGMVPVPVSSLGLYLTGFSRDPIDARPYEIDRYEVTNEEFKRFVVRGAYEQASYWDYQFLTDGQPLSWQEATGEFVDTTRRPGPSTWVGGSYPDDQGDHPVTGVSWYEAAAFCEFAGKSLPTAYHWLVASTPSLAGFIVRFSNFRGDGSDSIGSNMGMSAFGAFDMAGNAREWVWNEAEAAVSSRYILGGGWDESSYTFTSADARSPFDRSLTNGFRCARVVDTELSAELFHPIGRAFRRFGDEQPVDDDVFERYKAQYSYDKTDLNADVQPIPTESVQWTQERITIDAAYGGERFDLDLFLPSNSDPPHQVVVFWPGANAFGGNVPADRFIYLVQSGRGVLFPVYDGTFERNRGRTAVELLVSETSSYRDSVIRTVNDLRRGLDYLDTRPDIVAGQFAFYGVSWGASLGPLAVALEPRIRAAILVSGGLSGVRALPEADPFNFAPRVSVPVLMINGDQDYLFPVELSQKPLFELLGTAESLKHRTTFPGGHNVYSPLFRNRLLQETLPWLDEHLGPVN